MSSPNRNQITLIQTERGERMRDWTMKEHQFLRDNLNILTLVEIAEKLNRTYSSTYNQMKNMGLELTEKNRRYKFNSYAIYQGDEVIVTGTAAQCAKRLGVTEQYIHALLTPSRKKAIANRKNPGRARTAIKLEDDE